MTIICRDDMAPGYKVVQSAHALADFAVKHQDEFMKWQMGSNYLCCLEASEMKINLTIEKLKSLGIKYHIFCEPDIGNKMTAIAVEAFRQNTTFKTIQKI